MLLLLVRLSAIRVLVRIRRARILPRVGIVILLLLLVVRVVLLLRVRVVVILIVVYAMSSSLKINEIRLTLMVTLAIAIPCRCRFWALNTGPSSSNTDKLPSMRHSTRRQRPLRRGAVLILTPASLAIPRPRRITIDRRAIVSPAMTRPNPVDNTSIPPQPTRHVLRPVVEVFVVLVLRRRKRRALELLETRQPLLFLPQLFVADSLQTQVVRTLGRRRLVRVLRVAALARIPLSDTAPPNSIRAPGKATQEPSGKCEPDRDADRGGGAIHIVYARLGDVEDDEVENES